MDDYCNEPDDQIYYENVGNSVNLIIKNVSKKIQYWTFMILG